MTPDEPVPQPEPQEPEDEVILGEFGDKDPDDSYDADD